MTAVEEPIEEYESPVGWPCALPGTLTQARLTPYIPVTPWVPQRAFLRLRCLEAFYGGAAGGAKSWALLMAALQFADVPGYAALLLRKSYSDLVLPEALMDLAREWLAPTDARWSAIEHTWHFPSTASLTFGYCERDAQVMRYRSAAFQYIGIDELTQHSEYVYRYLFSRLRRPAISPGKAPDGLTLSDVPLRMRGASNPGDEGHAWVKARHVSPDTRRRDVVYIPSRLEDNPGLDREEYEKSLRELDPVNYERLRHGDWEVRDPGEIFHSENIHLVELPWPDERGIRRVRYWDMASTEVKPGNDPDFTVGFKLALDERSGLWRIEHIARARKNPGDVERLVQQTAVTDGNGVRIWIEQEPGSSGVAFIDHYRKHVLRGYRVNGDRPTGPKEVRIRNLEPIVNNGDVSCVLGQWTQDFIDELDPYPHVRHDDQMDAFAGAHQALSGGSARLLV